MMPDDELTVMWRQAKDQREQVKILAELNGVSTAVMAEKLRGLGCELPELPASWMHGVPPLNCGIHGCAVMRAAASSMENLQTENAALRHHIETLTSAQVVMVKEFTEKMEELAQVKAERDAAYQQLGGEPPKTCKTCELWGKSGWGQYQVGYCEGDDHPHGPDDFCSRHCPKKEA